MLCQATLTVEPSYDLVECPACGVIFLDPLPTVEALATFYGPTYYDFDRWREEGKGCAFARRLVRWRPTGHLLDVGCATGFFIDGIRNHSRWSVYGTDIGASAVRFARESLGLDVSLGDVADARFPAAFFDYVHVNNVLEHVRDPLSLLAECRRVIRPDGIFFLSVPNGLADVGDLVEFFRTEGRPARSKKGHIFFFPARTLVALVDRMGFRITKAKTYSWKPGLRSLGVLPRRSNWKKDYYPRTSPGSEVTHDAVPPSSRRPPSLYYEYRYLQNQLKMLPGLHRFGLDFMLLMTLK